MPWTQGTDRDRGELDLRAYLPASPGAGFLREIPRAGEEVGSKNNQPESTRAIPEELRLKLLPWVANFKKDLDKLKSVRENSGLGSREFGKLKAEIETKWELPYLPDSVVDGTPFDDPDILPVCTPVRIKTQRINKWKKDPRKGFFCRKCGDTFRKIVKTGEGYYSGAGFCMSAQRRRSRGFMEIG